MFLANLYPVELLYNIVLSHPN